MGTCGYQGQIALSKSPGLGEYYVYEDSYMALREHVNKVRKLSECIFRMRLSQGNIA